MRLSLSFWLAIAAMALAITAVAIRVGSGDYELSDVIAPIAISLLLLGIVTREWAATKGRTDD